MILAPTTVRPEEYANAGTIFILAVITIYPAFKPSPTSLISLEPKCSWWPTTQIPWPTWSISVSPVLVTTSTFFNWKTSTLARRHSSSLMDTARTDSLKSGLGKQIFRFYFILHNLLFAEPCPSPTWLVNSCPGPQISLSWSLIVSDQCVKLTRAYFARQKFFHFSTSQEVVICGCGCSLVLPTCRRLNPTAFGDSTNCRFHFFCSLPCTTVLLYF